MAERMPALFIGHGNPMNSLLVNPYTQRWASIGATLPKPKAILRCRPTGTSKTQPSP
jgi:4,5-DOPA dioxygenase extradiol